MLSDTWFPQTNVAIQLVNCWTVAMMTVLGSCAKPSSSWIQSIHPFPVNMKRIKTPAIYLPFTNLVYQLWSLIPQFSSVVRGSHRIHWVDGSHFDQSNHRHYGGLSCCDALSKYLRWGSSSHDHIIIAYPQVISYTCYWKWPLKWWVFPVIAWRFSMVMQTFTRGYIHQYPSILPW